MLSPGKWYERVPKDQKGNRLFRKATLQRALTDSRFRQALLEVCRQDFLFWVNVFVWQYNPNSVGDASVEVGPFLAWDFQDKAMLYMLDCIAHRKDLVIEKSREMGASWMCLLVVLWMFLFHPWKKFLVISRSEEAVDKPGDPDCLFWKIDFMLEHMPDWMAKPRSRRRKRGFRNPTNHSTITGQASTGKAGVGGRATAMFIDEFSQIKEDYEVLHRTSDTTGCRIFNFTHLGTSTAAYELTEFADIRGIRRLQLHWTQHPDKRHGLYRSNLKDGKPDVLDTAYPFPPEFNFVLDGTPTGGPFPGLRSPWYDEQCGRKGSDRAIAMDLDINAKGSLSQFFQPIMIRQLQDACSREPYWVGDAVFDHQTGRLIELVETPGGSLQLWLIPDYQGRLPLAPYSIGADISAGQGATCSCLSGVDCRTGEKVLEYANPYIDPKDFATLAVALSWFLKSESGTGAKLIWEVPGPGLSFGHRVIELGYRNVYFRVIESSLSKKVTEVYGWQATNETRRVLLEEYRSALKGSRFINRSKTALEECLYFIYTKMGVEHSGHSGDRDPTGAGVNHGDRTIADALAWKMAKDKVEAVKEMEQHAIVPGTLAWRRMLHKAAEREREMS